MRLKTTHGTYVVAQEGGELRHAPAPLDASLEARWDEDVLPLPEPGSAEAVITQGPLARSTLLVLADTLVAFRRDDLYLCAEPAPSTMQFDRNRVGEWETFTVESDDGAPIRFASAGGLNQLQLQQSFDKREIFSDPTRLRECGNTLPISLNHITEADLGSMLGGAASSQSLAIVLKPKNRAIEFYYVNSVGGVRLRVLDGIRYAYYIISTHQELIWDNLSKRDSSALGWIIRFEVGDLPTSSAPSVAFERKPCESDVSLVPDLYFFGFRGFGTGWFDGEIPAWEAKSNKIVWRGSTTGAFDLTEQSIQSASRFRLCALGAGLGQIADFGITDVVHARSDLDAQNIKNLLIRRGLWRERMPQHTMGANKYLVEIDGNANSWGFFAKLLMGCCILKVESPFEQWFYERLQPWVHYVPVASDLSDLTDRIRWCLQNESGSRNIADAGRRIAESLKFDAEMADAAHKFLSVAFVLR